MRKRKERFNLKSFNFCNLDDIKLIYLIDYLGHRDIIEKSESEDKISNGECIEKKWVWYDELIITPKEILFSSDPQPRRVIFTAEDYGKMRKIFI